MLNFPADFYEKLFNSMAQIAVLFQLDGEQITLVWCSPEFMTLTESAVTDLPVASFADLLGLVHPDDREAFRSFLRREQKDNRLTLRLKPRCSDWHWLGVRGTFFDYGGNNYAYCYMADVTTMKAKQQRSYAVYNSAVTKEKDWAKESLVYLRLNLTQGIVEDCRGTELYTADKVGNVIDDNLGARSSNFLREDDRRRFVERFSRAALMEHYRAGESNVFDVFYTLRPDGSRKFVSYNVSLKRNPTSGDIMAFAVERDYSAEMIKHALLNRVLTDRCDMIASLINGEYSVVIGNRDNMKKGHIFPNTNTGHYEDYLHQQIRPFLHGTEERQQAQLDALSLTRIRRELSLREPYLVNIACDIEGEIYYKQFAFYNVEPTTDFYLILKTDTTNLQREQIQLNTSLRQALNEANQANIAKTAFLSSMSHEIRTPMNAIIGLDSIALNEPNLPPRTRDQLTKIGESAGHLLSLINDILDMSRIESGRMMLKEAEFSFAGMLNQLSTMINSQCQERGLKYDCLIVGTVDDYYIGDVTKLKQILINLLGNAVKFTAKGGAVTFQVEQTATFEDKATLKFTVADTGVGIDEAYLPHVFDVFSQEDLTTTSKYGGSGLGLAITKNIVDLMNGEITVDSRKGEGSVFTVTLTLRRTARKEENLLKIGVEDLNVLVIDDDPIACEHAKCVLSDLNIKADTALSGREALEMIRVKNARHEAYNLLLVDLRMPDEDGVEITRQARQIISDESAIFILTDYSWDDVRDDAIAAGVDRFMNKPLFAHNVAEEFCQVISEKRAAHKKKADLNGRHILLAEDMPINAEIMKEILQMKNMQVDHAENGATTVQKFAASPENFYDAVLMDIRMPVMDGLEATSAIRALKRQDSGTVPIIAMTANAFDEDVQRSLQAGMNAHLAKPVDPDGLYETLAELIRR